MSETSERSGGVSILMPAFNLEGSIAANIARVVAATAEMGAVQIVVCDDGSTDGTREAAERAAEDSAAAVVVVGHRPNRGKGAALQTAFEAATQETIVFLDADLDLPPEQVPTFVARFGDLGVDALVGMKQAAMEPGRYPALRRVLSKIFSGVITLLFRLPVTETQTGLKAFRRDPLEKVLASLTVQRYTYDLELLVTLHRRGFTIAEAPVELAEGASSAGVSLGTLWEMGRDTLRIWWNAVVRRR